MIPVPPLLNRLIYLQYEVQNIQHTRL